MDILESLAILGLSTAATISILVAGVVILCAILFILIKPLNWWERRKGPRLGPAELAEQLKKFLETQDSEHDLEWDEFECVPIRDPDLDRIREHCVELSYKQAAISQESYFASEDEAAVRKYIRQLEQST